MKYKLFLVLLFMVFLPLVVKSAVLPTDTINVSWNPHPQHSPTAQASPPKAPITIHVWGRVAPKDMALDSSTPSYDEWGTAPGDGSFQMSGLSANYGEEIQVYVTSCWDDPTTAETKVECTGRSLGVAYVVPFILGNPTGLNVTVD